MMWTQELDTALIALLPTHSFTQAAYEIAKLGLPVTRSAVAGRVERLKQKGIVIAVKPKPAGRPRNARKPRRMVPVPTPLNIPFFDLAPKHCRWPSDGEGYKTLSCGHDKQEGQSYCPYHYSEATTSRRNWPGYRHRGWGAM